MLIERKRNGTDIDYDIIEDGKVVGLLQTLETEQRDYIFVRQIMITEKRKGYATKAIDELCKKGNVRLCIATESKSAIAFWRAYLEGKDYKNVRGEIYEIKSLS